MLQTATQYAPSQRVRPRRASRKRMPYRALAESLLRDGGRTCPEIAAFIGCGVKYVWSVANQIHVKPCSVRGPRINRSERAALEEAASMLKAQWCAQQKKWGFR